MVTKQLELTDEEYNLINKLRKEKSENKQNRLKQLEQEFYKVYQETTEKINQQIELARKSLKKAVELSNESGIPFTSDVVEFCDRKYCPDTSKWEEIKNIVSYDYGLNGDYGWEYWRTSSLTC